MRSSPYIQYNPEIHACYESIIQLQMEDAQAQLVKLKLSQKENLALVHLENYIDFFYLFITESRKEYTQRIPSKKQRLDLLDDINLKDPHLDFIKAEILLQWALINLKFDEKLAAGRDVYSAYKLLEGNKKKYPKFIENNKSLSILHALAESVPKWVRKIIGVKGSLITGYEEIEKLADFAYNDDNYFYREEVAAIYTYILFYQMNKREQALLQFDRFKLDHTKSPLLAFLKASMYLRAGKNDLSLQVLNDLKQNSTQLPFYYLDFMKGRSLLYKQETKAKYHLERFVNRFEGLHFIKEAYQKLAWYELSINNNAAGYKQYMALCLSKGADLVDEDKQALKEAKSHPGLNPVLLKARILYDGGYYTAAFQTLSKNEISLSKSSVHALEFKYRMGRVHQALKSYPEAISYLKSTLQQGELNHTYFAASAALQLGLIYEADDQQKAALYYFNKCLQINPPDYKTSLHQKAKSGVLRVSVSK